MATHLDLALLSNRNHALYEVLNPFPGLLGTDWPGWMQRLILHLVIIKIAIRDPATATGPPRVTYYGQDS
ncbi:unnamed protein product [marine sediment metagenome]|uniref:Uncharacterized protein n=1 Tax=marine sediment metagenome TaxID=412755 RepID=X1SSY1_9ZZZZ